MHRGGAASAAPMACCCDSFSDGLNGAKLSGDDVWSDAPLNILRRRARSAAVARAVRATGRGSAHAGAAHAHVEQLLVPGRAGRLLQLAQTLHIPRVSHLVRHAHAAKWFLKGEQGGRCLRCRRLRARSPAVLVAVVDRHDQRPVAHLRHHAADAACARVAVACRLPGGVSPSDLDNVARRDAVRWKVSRRDVAERDHRPAEQAGRPAEGGQPGNHNTCLLKQLRRSRRASGQSDARRHGSHKRRRR